MRNALTASGQLFFALIAPAALAATTTVATLEEAGGTPNGATTVAAGDTLVVTGDVASTGDSASARFDKQGAGTLVLQGANNSFKRVKHSAGTLVFDGGATTVAGGTGSGSGDGADVVFYGDETRFEGGATFSVNRGDYACFDSKSLVIENATVNVADLSQELLCNFVNGTFKTRSQGIVEIGEGGRLVVKKMRPHQGAAAAYKDKFGLRVVNGGVLEFVTGGTMQLDGAHNGFVHFDGGRVVGTATGNIALPGVLKASTGSVAAQWANSPITVGSKGFTIDNRSPNLSQITWQHSLSGADGDEGGALHVAGSGYNMVNAKNSFTGGVYLDSDDGALFRPYFDETFGAEPAEPRDNVFVRGKSAVMFAGTLDVSANRNVRIAENRTFNVIPQNGQTVTFHGEINGEGAPDALPTATAFHPRWQWVFEPSFVDKVATNAWKGGVVALDPGEGRTNSVGRLDVEGKLEIKSGVTVACSPSAGTGANAPVWVHGTGAAADDGVCGVLVVSGGALEIAAGSKGKYFEVDARGKVDVCGGELRTNGGEYLNALASYGQTVIRDGGVIDCGGANFRVVQTVSDPSAVVVRLATNGVLRCNQLRLDVNYKPKATFLFDGGWLVPTTKNNSFCASGLNAAWDGVTFAVGPGGAGFEVEAGNNVFIYRTLTSDVAEGEKDGGLMVRGPSGTATCLMVAQAYTGPTTIDGNELQQRDGDDLLPAGTDIVLKNGGILALDKYDAAHTPTAATLGGVSGDGYVKNCSAATFTGTFAPAVGGTVEFQAEPKAPLSGTLLVSGDATGCGTLKFHSRLPAQDISGLTLAIEDVSALDRQADKNLYKIVEGPYSGEMALADGFPSGEWSVRYRNNAVYLSHVDPLVMVVR